MNRKMLAAALLGAIVTSGCVQNYATREVAQGAAPASLMVLNAPAGARVLVDGREAGIVGQASDIPLAVGRHQVVIEAADRVLHTQAVYVSAGARVEVRVP